MSAGAGIHAGVQLADSPVWTGDHTFNGAVVFAGSISSSLGLDLDTTLNAATGDEVAYTLAYTVNKATSGNDTGLLIDMTDTASPGTSLLINAAVGGTSKFKVDNAGGVTAAGSYICGGGGYLGVSSVLSLRFPGNRPTIYNVTPIHQWSGSASGLRSDWSRSWSSTTDPNGTADLFQRRIAAATLGLGEAAAGDAAGVDQEVQAPAGGTSTTGNGLAGGDLTITAGDGSDAFATEAGDGGAGGNIILSPGTGGAGDGAGGAGAGGNVQANVTLGAATGDEVAMTLAYTVNKATSGADTGLLIDMTDTASPGISYPLNITVGGTSKLNVDPSGKIQCGAVAATGDISSTANVNCAATGALFMLGRTALRSSADGIASLTNNAGSAPSTLQCSVLVEANTAIAAGPNVLTALESRTVLTNEGATAENHHDLPTAVAGLRYTFIVQDADGIQVNAAPGDTIRIAGTASASAGFVSSTTIGDVLDLVAINATEWVSMAPAGSWTFDT